MSVWTQSSQWQRHSGVVRLQEFKIILVLPVLVFVASYALAQKPTPTSTIPPPVGPGTNGPVFRTIPTSGQIALAAAQKSENGTCFLPPLDLASSPLSEAEQLRIPGEARKEYQGACSALMKNKYPDAEKHLRKAVKEYRKYSAAWVTLGQVLAAQQRTEDARGACSKASTEDAIYVPAYLCLADIAARSQDWDAELKLSSRALELDPSKCVVAYEYHATANANLHHLAEAEKSGLKAVDIDRDHREPRVHFLLAQIYEMEGNSAGEVEQLRQYLKYAHNPQGRAQVKEMLSKLENGSGQTVTLASADALQEVPVRSEQHWAPADIDELTPPVLDDGNCPLTQIVRETSNRTEDLIENLQRFSARERIEQTDINNHGKRRSSSVQTVNYIAHIEQRSSPYPVINEYRSGSTEVQRARVVDSGTAAFALIFHASHVGNLNFRCEGLTELRGQRAWQVRFEESADPDKAFTTMRTDSAIYTPRLKGRAWIASGSYDILRIETDLVAPIRQINLNMEHLIINYAPVEFPARHIRLWLPESAALYISYQGHNYERVHSFGQFQLFSVEVNEAIKEPGSAKSDEAKQ